MKSLTIILIIFLAMITGKVNATNLRGQIVRNIGGTYQPLPATRVDLMVWSNNKWTSYSYAITGADGFYYFNNFPPGATFCLLVLGHYYPPKPLQILNIPPPQYQDLPVIST
jgi:hypothetical protein